jgi:hypothetical protein
MLTTHPTPNPGATEIAAGPSSSHRPAATDGPVAPGQPWADLEVPPFEQIADFAPNDGTVNSVALDSSFTVRSRTSTPALEVVRGLRVDPPVELIVQAGPTSDVAIVKPAATLLEGVRYRVRLDAPDGALAGSWTFKAQAPLHIVSTVPGDRTSEVPTNTGIEVEFDQDGTQGFGDHFRIEPPAPGRFEQHARVWSFVPNNPLAAATIYTVTVTPGVGVEGSRSTLDEGMTFRFETDVQKHLTNTAMFDRPAFETRPGEQPVLPLGEPSYDEKTDEPVIPKSVTVDVHRLPTFDDAVAAAVALAGTDSWARYATEHQVDTSSLTRIARVEGKVLRADAGLFVRLPFQPQAGLYVLTIVQEGPPAQLLLQVTNLGAYALTGTRDSVVWVNDLAAGKALTGATVAIARGASLGSTDANGVLRFATPADLSDVVRLVDRDPDPRLLVMTATDGRRLIVPIGLRVSGYSNGYEGPYSWDGSDDSANWWLLLRTDRQTYRQTDTVNVSGMIRARADRSVPGGLELRLRAYDSPVDLAIQRIGVQATERGVFTASMQFNDLPRGSYLLDLFAGAKLVTSVSIEIDEIRKPAFKLDVTTDRHVYVLGQQVRISAAAAFYDGTPVPGMDLRFSAFDRHATSSSDSAGNAAAQLGARSDYDVEGWFENTVGVAPAHPEEGQVEGTAPVVLLPARVWLAGAGTLTNGRIVVQGTLTWADLKGMEAKLDAGSFLVDGDGPGRPIGAGSITAQIYHEVIVKHQTGTQYDFIEKRVVPAYEYQYKEVSIGTRTLTSASGGAFRLSMLAPVATDQYRVELIARDPEGRRFRRNVDISMPYRSDGSRAPYLLTQSVCGLTPSVQTTLNQPFTVTMHDGDGHVASNGRFLFLVSERGSMQTTVLNAATFSRTLRDADLPGFTIRAIWLSDKGYFTSDAAASVDPANKRITIRLAPDKARYQPGEHANVAITTTGPDGRPVAADVVVQGVDEKLFTLGLAADQDPAAELMQRTSAGFLQSYVSHRLPIFTGDGCGGAGGGGERAEFRDSITFQRVTTGTDGHGSIAFDMSDDLTSWHLTATAVDAKLDSGFSAVQLPVGLPFFIDAVLAPEYLTGETPILRVGAFGRALSARDSVQYTIEAPTLGLKPTTVRGRAFVPARLALPTLVAGDHRIRIAAEASLGGRTYKDTLIRTIHVSATRLTGLVTSYDVLDAGFMPKGGPGLTTYAISDAGRGRLIELLESLVWDSSARFDKLAAADVARRLLIDRFGFSADSLPPVEFDASRYEQSGITLLSYSSTDLFLSARAALAVPELINRSELGGAFQEWANDAKATRERTLVALAGRAGIGDDVLALLHAYVPADLTVRERLWLALGLAASGDDGSARAIERELLESAGQRLGPWVRLAVGPLDTDTTEATGLLLLLASRLGDPLAPDISAYLRQVPSNEMVFPLEQVGYAAAFLDRLPRNPGKFAWTIAGERHEVTLQPGGGLTLALTSEQRSSLKLERLDGDLAVVTSWTSPDFMLPTSSTISVKRTVSPANDAADDRLVKVTITIDFGTGPVAGCYRLTDLVPSGLSPVARTAAWPGTEDEDHPLPENVNWPYLASGQQVSWCASPEDTNHTYVYAARVVSPGTYRWEPAVLQLELDPRIGASTPATTFTIR